MLLNCYSIYDRKALQYHAPFFQSTDGAALRSLSDLVADANTTVGRHPGDYVLYLIGQYDDQKGRMIPCEPLVHVIDAVALVPAKANLPNGKDLFSRPAGDEPQGRMADYMRGEQ